ncbi:MAG: hypothetical protein WA417_19560 [Stellaceae bacterium]
MIIGNSTGPYTGELSTLTAGARKLVFQPIEAKSEGPSIRSSARAGPAMSS